MDVGPRCSCCNVCVVRPRRNDLRHSGLWSVVSIHDASRIYWVEDWTQNTKKKLIRRW